MLLLIVLLCGPAAAQSTSCVNATCAWSLGGEIPVADAAWTPVVDEVEPQESWATGLSLVVNGTARAGSFMLMSPPIPVEGAGAFSVALRSSGALERFAFLIREEGYEGWRENPEAGDTVIFHPATSDWAFASRAWTPKQSDSTHVRIALRGEVREGASAGIHFRDPYFGPDSTHWSLEGRDEPFAHGPRAQYRFDAPGDHLVRAAQPNGTREFRVNVPDVPPELRLQVLSSPELPGGIRFDGTGTASPFHPNRLRNGDFDDGVAGWRLAPHELGPEGALAPHAGGARVSVSAPSMNGAAWASQRVEVTPGAPHEFSWHARDDGGILMYAVVLFEPANGARHLLQVPPAAGAEVAGFVRFTPASEVVEVQLRVIFAEGVAGAAWFDDVTLRRAMDYRWTLGGETLPIDAGVVDVAVNRSEPVEVVLEVADAHGGSAKTTRVLEPGALDGDVSIRLRGEPLVALRGERLVLDAGPTLGSRFNALHERSPWRSWSTDDEEAPGRLRVDVQEKVLRVGMSKPSETLGGGLLRHVVLPNHDGPFELSFHYRTSGHVVKVQGVARFHDLGGSVLSEVRTNYSASAEWRSVTLTLPNVPPSYESLVVGLRGVFEAGFDGEVEFSDPILIPKLEYRWRLDGEEAEGLHVALASPDAKVVDWGLLVETPGGLTLHRSGQVRFVDAIVPFPTLKGTVEARWDAAHFPTGVSVVLDGPRRAEVDATARRLSTGLESGTYVVTAVSSGGHRAVLSSVTYVDATGLPSEGRSLNATRGEVTEFSFPLPNPDLTEVEMRFTSPVRQAFAVPLHRELDNGTWTAEWTPPLHALPGPYRVDLLLRDVGGETQVVSWGAAHVAVSPGAPQGAFPTAVAVAAVAAIAWMPLRGWGRK